MAFGTTRRAQSNCGECWRKVGTDTRRNVRIVVWEEGNIVSRTTAKNGIKGNNAFAEKYNVSPALYWRLDCHVSRSLIPVISILREPGIYCGFIIFPQLNPELGTNAGQNSRRPFCFSLR